MSILQAVPEVQAAVPVEPVQPVQVLREQQVREQQEREQQEREQQVQQELELLVPSVRREQLSEQVLQPQELLPALADSH